MSDDADFEFDLAFSFHGRDEGLALRINDLLQDRLRTFIYSEHQKLLAGRDGEEVFNSIFERRSRCVAILYRREWGETPFTRIEQTAIRNRAYREGFDFSLFIPTEAPATAPPWLPKTRLYYGLERFGLSGAAATLEQLALERGGEPRTETVLDRAARLERAINLSKAKARFRNSDAGVAAATAAADELFQRIEDDSSAIARAHSALAGLKAGTVANNRLVSGLGPVMHLDWWCQFVNTLDGSELRATIYSGVPRLPGVMRVADEPRTLKKLSFDYELLGPDRHGYVAKDSKRAFSVEELAAELLRIYMDVGEQHRRA